MPRRRSLRKKACVHVYIDEEVFYFFKALLLSPTEGRVKNGFSTLVERLLAEERQRLITASQAIAKGDPTNGSPDNGGIPQGPGEAGPGDAQ